MTAATIVLGLLLALALAGAGGVLLCRRLSHCCASFVICCAALAGVYGILDLRFAAIVQFAVAVGLFGLVFLAASSWFEQQSTRRTWWIGLTSVPFAALAAWALSHSGIRQVGAGPLVPTWTVSGSHLAVLGREWLTRYSVILVLLGLLLLTGLVSLTYLIRDHWDPFQEKET